MLNIPFHLPSCKIFMLLISDFVFVVRSLFLFNITTQTRGTYMAKRLIFHNDRPTIFFEMNYTQDILRAINRRMYLSSISMVLHE